MPSDAVLRDPGPAGVTAPPRTVLPAGSGLTGLMRDVGRHEPPDARGEALTDDGTVWMEGPWQPTR
ncbi:hypothetical protein FAF44_49765 [Nonomuraea sp. MG754425]|uniref:hypothetical protein n=1 Tax=Nonomuraea sp. MG754425 TaxID=2570319 RepID=UPI001F31EBCD|nr:hypothetical protein [Nonomuraea sp. MG754425]MCF6476377.1 hypothetical protein [Nonomuraea sp. MG754425]